MIGLGHVPGLPIDHPDIGETSVRVNTDTGTTQTLTTHRSTEDEEIIEIDTEVIGDEGTQVNLIGNIEIKAGSTKIEDEMCRLEISSKK